MAIDLNIVNFSMIDINILRGLAAVFCFAAFGSVVFWAYSGRNHQDFDDAAQLPFADEGVGINNKNHKVDGEEARHV